MEFLVPLIDDVNFKVCLTTMNMVTKLLVLDFVVLEDELFQQLGSALIKKLCDAKVVIR